MPPCSTELSHSLDREDEIKTSIIVAFELFSSLNAEEGTRPQATQPSPLPHKNEGKRSSFSP